MSSSFGLLTVMVGGRGGGGGLRALLQVNLILRFDLLGRLHRHSFKNGLLPESGFDQLDRAEDQERYQVDAKAYDQNQSECAA